MAPPLYLNATCVEEETLGYAYIDTTTFSESTCAMASAFLSNKYWTANRIFCMILFMLCIGIFVWSLTFHFVKNSIIKRIRMLPTAHVHETIEAWTKRSLLGGERLKFQKYEEGRFKSVTESVDDAARIRTVTIVEDLNKKPLKTCERWRMPKVPRGWNSARDLGAVPGALAADVPLERVGSEAQLAAPNQVYAPPPYKHFN
jgi:hypothetical protein